MGLLRLLIRTMGRGAKHSRRPKPSPRPNPRNESPAPAPSMGQVASNSRSEPQTAPEPGPRDVAKTAAPRRATRYPDRQERARRAVRLAEAASSCGGKVLRGKCHVIDGDTIVIRFIHIRLGGIDAPELDQPWGQKAKWAMVALCKGNEITAHVTGEMSHDRVVATCTLPDGRDLAAELVKQGLALDWPCFSGGKYRCLEPEGARRKLWRAARRQAAG